MTIEELKKMQEEARISGEPHSLRGIVILLAELVIELKQQLTEPARVVETPPCPICRGTGMKNGLTYCNCELGRDLLRQSFKAYAAARANGQVMFWRYPGVQDMAEPIRKASQKKMQEEARISGEPHSLRGIVILLAELVIELKQQLTEPARVVETPPCAICRGTGFVNASSDAGYCNCQLGRDLLRQIVNG